jgi:hypothetical protein
MNSPSGDERCGDEHSSWTVQVMNSPSDDKQS